MLLLAVLLLLVLGLVYFLCNRRTRVALNATIQGETTLPAGDIIMKVWDNEAEDGDTVTVYFDGKLIKENLAILNTPDTFAIGHLKKGVYLLEVKAISEGSSAPATTTVSLTDGSTEREFAMEAYKDSAAAWKVIVE